ncbi:pilus assembly protein PilP [Desulfobulbus sp. TB]|nr:pilus assembly protein PilP [Desulfobulbus sp. TB]
MKLTEKKYFVAIFLFFGATLFDSVSWATEDDVANKEEEVLREVDKFQYQLENRPDPFLPFLSEKKTQNTDDDTPAATETGKRLVGMQRFEPGQLKLVALLTIGNKKVAMAEDVTGKGYRLNENMHIGRYGIINRIRDEHIEITESYKTKTGRMITKEIVMRLKKDGDK